MTTAAILRPLDPGQLKGTRKELYPAGTSSSQTMGWGAAGPLWPSLSFSLVPNWVTQIDGCLPRLSPQVFLWPSYIVYRRRSAREPPCVCDTGIPLLMNHVPEDLEDQIALFNIVAYYVNLTW